jgi:hypothetical protein
MRTILPCQRTRTTRRVSISLGSALTHLFFGATLIVGEMQPWLVDTAIMIQENGRTRPVVETRNLAWTRDGHIPFSMQNALIATAIARSCGLSDRLIAAGLGRPRSASRVDARLV